MRIVALSEAASKLLAANSSLEGSYPEMRWRELIWIRNRLAHDYFGVLPERVWNAIQINIPMAANVIKRLENDFPH